MVDDGCGQHVMVKLKEMRRVVVKEVQEVVEARANAVV